MNKLLLKLCEHKCNPTSCWLPLPSTYLCKVCDMTLYQTRKELNKLKEQGLVTSDRYCEIGEDRNYLLNGYTITEKAKETEEYKKAYVDMEKIFKECFEID